MVIVESLKKKNRLYRRFIKSTPGGIRTPNPRIRSPMLYPIEPRVHMVYLYRDLSIKAMQTVIFTVELPIL